MKAEDRIDFSMGPLPPETPEEREARQKTEAENRGAATTGTSDRKGAAVSGQKAKAGESADTAAAGEERTEETAASDAEQPAVFHTRRNSPAPAGFHTRTSGHGSGIAQGSAASADRKRRTEEEKEPPKAQARRWLKAALRAAVLAVIGYALVYIALTARDSREDIDVRKYADSTAVTVDGEDVTFADLAFYIMYEEMKVEQQAEVYNPDNTRDYWNILMDGVYLSARVKDMVMGMAVHDRIFYNEAVRAGITLSEDEKTALEARRTDFWEDLYPSQAENLLASHDDINHVMYEIGLAEKYQQSLAIENNVSYNSYDWNGKNYEKLRDEEHKVKVNKDLWHRFHMGNNTLVHGDANFIQGTDAQEKARQRADGTLKDIFFKSRE